MENIRGKSLKEWKQDSDKDRHNILMRTQKYIVCLEEKIEQLLIQRVVGRSEQLVCSCGSIKVQTTGGSQCPNNRCSSAD